MATDAVTEERITPGAILARMYHEHYMRYKFATTFTARCATVVDVACGNGIGTDFLKRSGVDRCVGVDIDSRAVELARATYSSCEFLQSDGTHINLPDHFADVVVSFETVEHIADHVAFLAECKRLLRPGGVFICSTPNRKIFQWDPPNPFHVKEWRGEPFFALIASMFSDVQRFGQVMVHYPRLAVRRSTSRLLASVGIHNVLKKMLKKLFIDPPMEVISEMCFTAGQDYPEFRVLPYPAWPYEPAYFVALARNQ